MMLLTILVVALIVGNVWTSGGHNLQEIESPPLDGGTE
jgi:hypothetical protein